MKKLVNFIKRDHPYVYLSGAVLGALGIKMASMQPSQLSFLGSSPMLYIPAGICGLFILLAPLAKARIFPRSLVSKTTSLSYSPAGAADRTIPVTVQTWLLMSLTHFSDFCLFCSISQIVSYIPGVCKLFPLIHNL